MTIDIGRYEGSRAYIESSFKSKYTNDPKRAISELASVTFVPCIAIAYMIGPLCNWDERVVSSIKNLISFYGYTKIEGKPEGAPI